MCVRERTGTDHPKARNPHLLQAKPAARKPVPSSGWNRFFQEGNRLETAEVAEQNPATLNVPCPFLFHGTLAAVLSCPLGLAESEAGSRVSITSAVTVARQSLSPRCLRVLGYQPFV